MTDLERARDLRDKLLEHWGGPLVDDGEVELIADALAAARREGAEAAKDDIAQLKGDVEEVGRAAFIRGAAEMRERAASATAFCCFECSRVIRALPLTPEA